MKLCRFRSPQGEIQVGVIQHDSVANLSAAGVQSLTSLLEDPNLPQTLGKLIARNLPQHALSGATLLAPVERQEVWAAGVTYLRSKTARMEESEFSANAYDRVYAAERPELFFKALPEKVVGPNDDVGIRRDARWNVPEPELALVINSRGQLAGYTIGNDMSSRDIEGENVLYLPQAKIYHRSCAVGPCITVAASESEARTWQISLQIERSGRAVFRGETSVDQIKRPFQELAGFVCRSQQFPQGVVLLTGTGIVPPDTFTLEERDVVRIEISGIGTLVNPVVRV